ncbi:MAG: type II toxin-antitoxin system VapC family toxin [Solirubrobacterales bacterium]
MILADASAIFALLDRADERHEITRAWFARTRPALVTVPLVLAEVDFLAGSRGGQGMRTAFRRDVIAGAYRVNWWNDAAVQAAEIAQQYADLGVSLADTSLVALAARMQTTEIATFDERHFRAMRPLWGGDAFRLLPLEETIRR